MDSISHKLYDINLLMIDHEQRIANAPMTNALMSNQNQGLRLK